MKKKILLGFVILLVVAISAYFYVYKSHRDIAAESADFKLTVPELQAAFQANDSLATRKYQDHTIEVSGKLTEIDQQSHAVVLDQKLFAVFTSAIPAGLSVNQTVTVKGRFLAYDDLLEEFKMDQTTIIR